MTEFLEEKVTRMLEGALRGKDARAPDLPLVRLRVSLAAAVLCIGAPELRCTCC